MTALDDIKEIEREASAFDRKLLRALTEERANRIEERIRGLRDTLLDAPGEIIAFYKMTDLLTRRMTTENAVTVWKKTRPAYTSKFLDDLDYWRKTNPKLSRRIYKLVQETIREPFTGIGKPEPLPTSYP